ncbi:PREDICTED: G-protein coupled receptor 35-like [Chaetura pelagica]|uniref:G-protein coupled receptor 35-like n=1 Tax=Chaetura pelagica TaxID=8897 RepID=UPI00052346E7|nr:PREDICTED: G-protein coupled receptor 35-like [Chaetura pelagica]
MYFINMVMSIYIISFISIDRYIAIKHPLKARIFRSPSRAALLCGLLWVSVITAYLGILARVIMESFGATCFLLQLTRNFSSMTRCIATSNCCLDSVCYYFSAASESQGRWGVG